LKEPELERGRFFQKAVQKLAVQKLAANHHGPDKHLGRRRAAP
jgi:hypothetical protein